MTVVIGIFIEGPVALTVSTRERSGVSVRECAHAVSIRATARVEESRFFARLWEMHNEGSFFMIHGWPLGLGLAVFKRWDSSNVEDMIKSRKNSPN